MTEVPQTQDDDVEDIVVVDLETDLEVMSGYSVTVEYKGALYKIEQWATDNSSGVEVYDASGASLHGDSLPDALVDWEMDEDPRIEAFWERFHAEVEPLVERIKAEVFTTK